MVCKLLGKLFGSSGVRGISNKELSPKARNILSGMEGHNGMSHEITKHFIDDLSQDQRELFIEKWPKYASL